MEQYRAVFSGPDYNWGGADYYLSLILDRNPPFRDRRVAEIHRLQKTIIPGMYPTALLPTTFGDPVDVQVALAEYVRRMYAEAAVCYIEGLYHATVSLAAAALEGALKREIARSDPNWDISKNMTLGNAIFKAEREGILVDYPEADRTTDNVRGELPPPDKEARVAADRVNGYRNDLMHANPERKSPKSTSQINEVTDIAIGEVDAEGHVITVGWLRHAGEAKNALRDVKIVFDHLYPGDSA